MLGETIVIIFAELTRFCKSEDECETEQDRLLYLLKNSPNLKSLLKWSDEEHCKSILEAFRIQNFDEQKCTQYENDMMEERELNSKLETAEAKGEARGEAKGISKAKLTIQMLKDGVTIEQICKDTGLTEGQVAELQALL